MPQITLTILTPSFAEFTSQAKQAEKFLDYVQIDVMDGKFVAGKSFKERQEINDLGLKLKFELHLMVEHPLAEMKTWEPVNNIFRVIIPFECKDDINECLKFIANKGWKAGLVINPDTPLTGVLPYLEKIEVLLFMTVYPGQQGAKFVPKVLEKIKELVKINPRPLCAVDGGVNTMTIKLLASAGVEIFNVGSAMTKAEDMEKVWKMLNAKC